MERTIFLTFCLTSLAFRPIPTCFCSPIQSSLSYPLSHSFSMLFLLQLSRYIQRNRELYRLLELSCESHRRANGVQITLTREERHFFFCAEIYVVIRNERVSRKFLRVCVTHGILVCDKLSATVEK